MNDCIDTLEERVLLGELGYYLSIVGQVGSDEFGSNISLGGCRGNLIDYKCQSLLQTHMEIHTIVNLPSVLHHLSDDASAQSTGSTGDYNSLLPLSVVLLQRPLTEGMLFGE
jgi:hypothetical protein